MDSNISHSNEYIICIMILCDISTLIVPYSPSCSRISNFFAKGSYFNLNAEPANLSLALHHNLMDLPPTRMNSSCQHLISLPAVLLPSTSGKGNLQMIKKPLHFVLNFLQISTIFVSFSRAHARTLQNRSISPCTNTVQNNTVESSTIFQSNLMLCINWFYEI
jgi:hypothetical protein